MLKFKTTVITMVTSLVLPFTVHALNDPSKHSSFDQRQQDFECRFSAPLDEPKSKMQFVKNWSALVAKQSFTFPYEKTEAYLEKLKGCYTAEGWEAFSMALKHSGNLELVQDKRFSSTSQVVGLVSISHEDFTPIWETNVPINLVYQNKQQRFNQELIVHLRLREVGSGKFLVEQIIGYPKVRTFPQVANLQTTT